MRMKSSQANRGMSFEALVEAANAQYAAKGIALVQKIATPWKVLRNGKGAIVNAFPEKKSTVDFIGVENGTPIAFDTKSTKNKTSFPTKMIEPHQYKFMLDWNERGGVAFLLVEFSTLQEVYRVDVSQIAEWWLEYKSPDGRSSIPLWFFQKYCQRVTQGRGVVLDYLAPQIAEQTKGTEVPA